VLLLTISSRSMKTMRGSGPKSCIEFLDLVLAKTLCATKQARPDTCTAITFFMVRVQEAPNKDDWSKLVHLMKHLRGTRMLLLILS
jgi:hypothetical protein